MKEKKEEEEARFQTRIRKEETLKGTVISAEADAILEKVSKIYGKKNTHKRISR